MTGGVTSRRATINDVASAAGVSRQTVTRAMNDMRGISEATKLRVLGAARDLSYRPSRFGRGLVKPELQTLGLLIDDLTNPFYPELASAVLGQAAKNGWNVVLADVVHTTDKHALIADLAAQVDAIVGYLQFDEAMQPVLDGLPVVEIDPGTPRYGAVILDLGPAMAEAVAHLVAAGVRRPVMIDVSSSGVPGGRAALLVEKMRELGITTEVVMVGENAVAAGSRR
ncbi:MAG: LacI family DNA-binding transcriptional regulator, partial [Propionibacteriaceae bacterium]